MNTTITQHREGGKFITLPSIPLSRAKEIAGSPPPTWEPYTARDAVRVLYENNLCLMAQKRIRTRDGMMGPMVGVWKARKAA